MLDGTDIAEALNKVVVALNKLGLHVLDELNHYPVWVDNGQGEFADDRDKVIYAIKHEIKATAAIRHILAYNGFPGIKLKQVYRHLHWIDFHPRRISFSQVKHNSRRIITKAQAEQRIIKAGKGLHIDVQLAKLSLLGSDVKLVIHRDIPDCWIANIATFKKKSGKSSNSHFYSFLPVFYLHDSQLPMPQVVFAQKNNRDKTASRVDKRIEDKPFLTSIRAYRYRY